MRSQNRKPQKRSRCKRSNLNREMRQSCCWNCFQIGHLRYQCPFPKVEVCSFCRHPGTRSSDCNCPEAKAHFNRHVPTVTHVRTNSQLFALNVVVPINAHSENPHYEEKDNIVVFVDNHQNSEEEDYTIQELYDDEDADILELYAEEDDLSKI